MTENILLGISLLVNVFLLIALIITYCVNQALASELRIKNKKIARYRRREVSSGYYEDKEPNRENDV